MITNPMGEQYPPEYEEALGELARLLDVPTHLLTAQQKARIIELGDICGAYDRIAIEGENDDDTLYRM